MTKLLILSDSHNNVGAVERILHAESDATAVIYLGDGLRDLEEALTLHPKMRVYAVAGNCDFGALEPLDGFAAFDQVVVFYTHGHMYGVKYDLDTLVDAASAVTQAEAAGMGTTLMPRASASRTMTSPGSDTQGIPASLHKAQLSPASMRCKMASPFCKACS